MNVKVLKSFVSAHEAVNWLTQNRIEDTSIETTGSLKSMGMGPVPSGNYHVVLKGRASQARDEIASGERTAFRAEADLGVEHPYDVSAKFNDTRAGGRRAERLRKVDEAVDPNLPKKGEAGSLEHFEEWAASKHADWPYDDLTHYADEHGLTDEEFDKFEYHMEKTKAVSSISPEELTKVITKAIMGVLKSKDVSVDTTEIKQDSSSKPPVGQRNLSKEEQQSLKEKLVEDGVLVRTPPRNLIMGKSISKEVTDVITKAVMDALKARGMGDISKEAFSEAVREFDDNKGSWNPMIDIYFQEDAQESVDKEANRLLTNRPGDKTREERVGKVKQRADERLQDAREIQDSIADPDGGEPGHYPRTWG